MYAVFRVVILLHGIRCTCLVIRSTTTNIALYISLESQAILAGKSTIKSIAICRHLLSAVGRGRKSPCEHSLEGFEREQVWQLRTYCFTCRNIPCQKRFLANDA
ncbi:BgtTE-56110 [Blumeria graminis f. sp. tritici]|uniref:BgtTE-56076 n=1 Tax=Blumeria graminis f. sp. tritici TaxID=62690 RepID=A0A9X9QE38_BLUGR|nr:BgtTE-56076 [Blumeria graminis f. sp. tritici]VDB92970.1 BgtTE-56110 [Blumeria graminis f. sp. tritici]